MINPRAIARLFALLLCCLPTLALAQGAAEFFGGGYRETTGLVYKQGFVIDENSPTGQPSYAIYNAETGDFLEAIPDLDPAGEPYFIANGTDYRASSQAYVGFLASLTPERLAASRVMTVNEYGELDAQGYTKGDLLNGTRSVRVYDPQLLDATVQLDAEAGLLLFQSRFDLNELENSVAERDRSLLINDQGMIAEISENTIGYRVAYVEPDDNGGENERDRLYEPGDSLLAPINTATVSTGLNLNAKFPTNDEGRYSAGYYIPPCPGFTHSYSIPVNVSIPYATYNPQTARTYGEYMFWGLTGFTCSGPPLTPNPGLGLAGVADYINAIGVYNTINNTPVPANFPIDVTLISGRFQLVEEDYVPSDGDNKIIPVGEKTLRVPPPEKDPNDSDYETPEPRDYNGDEEDDHISEIGALTDVFVQGLSETDREKIYGVWFSVPDDAILGEGGLVFGVDEEPIEPDLVRVADIKPNFESIGLLQQISEDDMLETDLYVFRESTGELVVEKKNFAKVGDRKENAINGVDEESSLGFFELTVPGRNAQNSFRNIYRDRSVYQQYEDWQASQGIQEPLQGREVDSLRVGEPLKVVIVNRATGYLGTASTSVIDVSTRSINITLPDIKLYPPNIRVQVERQYEVERGLTAGEIRNYQVGSEGAALTSDQYVVIQTQWLDHDGTALPSELPGFTGRVANLVADKTLATADAVLNHFSINPGKHTEVLKIPNASVNSEAEHQYLHVVGREKNAMPDSPDFNVNPESDFPTRPEKFVPVKVAIYDEEASIELDKVQRSVITEPSSTQNIQQDSSVYRWVHRPEMQYSVLDLDIHNIEAIRLDENDNENERDITDTVNPVLVSGDESLTIQHSLITSEYDPLTLFGGDDLVVSLADYEQLVSVTNDEEQNQAWNFTEFGHLSELEGVDLLSLNLIQNSDAGNVLWEWAFEYLFLETQYAALDTSEIQAIYISADDPVIPLQAELLGFSNRPMNTDAIPKVRWSVSGVGRLENTVQDINEEGVIFNDFTASTTTNARALLSVALLEDPQSKVTIGEFITIPGAASVVNAKIVGEAYVANTRPVTVEVNVRDAHGNIVSDDTSVNISVTGSAMIDDYESGTVDGAVEATIDGGLYPGDYEVIVEVPGTPEQRLPFTVKPYTVTISELPERMLLGQSGALTLTAVDENGMPAPQGTAFQLFSTGLIIDQESTIADENGVAVVNYTAGYAPGDITVRASVGYTKGDEKLSTIRNSLANGPVPVEVQQRVLIGNQTSDGTVGFERYDGVVLDLPYTTELNVSLNGEPGETIDLVLGTPERPNVQPIAAYNMSDEGDVGTTVVGNDSVGLHHAELKQSDPTADPLNRPQRKNHYHGQPGDSLVFDSLSYLEADLPTAKINTAALGFRVDVYVDDESEGDVFSLASDVASLKLLAGNAVRFAAMELQSDGTQVQKTLQSAALETGWHTIAGVFRDGLMELYVDTELQVSEPLLALALPTDSDGETLTRLPLRMGEDFKGALDNLEMYDPESEPLVELSNDEQTGSALSVVMDASGNGSVTLSSTGRMNEAFGESLSQRTVLLSSSVETIDYINLMALDDYTAFASVYATTLYDGPEIPGIDDSVLEGAWWQPPSMGMESAVAVRDFFIPPAHALFGFNRSSFFKGLAGIASLVLPIYEIKEIWLQLSYLATDPEKFEAGELVINVISLATYFPVLRPLQPVLTPLKRFYRRYGNRPYTKAVGGVVGEGFEELVKKRRADKLLSIVPYLLVLYEMFEHPEAVEFMIDGISSNDDLFAWINYFNLPEDGWEGEGPPPLVSQLDDPFLPEEQIGFLPNILSFFISDAHAMKGKRKNGSKFGFTVKRLLEDYPGLQPKNFTLGIKELTTGLQSAAATNLRKINGSNAVLFSSTVLAKVARVRFRKFLQGRTSSRIPPAMFFAIVAYLEAEQQKDGYIDGLEDSDHIAAAIKSKYVTAMADILLPGAIVEESAVKDKSELIPKYFAAARTTVAALNGSAHGSMFHLAMVAFYTATGELKTTERARRVGFYSDKTTRTENGKIKKTFLRHVDIILNGDTETSEKWVELKSLQRRTLTNEFKPSSDGFKTWGGQRGKSFGFSRITYHKQFTLDRAAWKGNARFPKNQNNDEILVKVDDFEWKFHQFDVKAQPRFSIKEAKSVQVGSVDKDGNIRERLSSLVSGNAISVASKIFSLDLEKSDGKQTTTERKEVANKIDDFTILNVLKEKLEGFLDEELVNELEVILAGDPT